MEVIRFLSILVALVGAVSCSNNPELETGEIKTFQVFQKALSQPKKPEVFVDARQLLPRKKVDEFQAPVLYVKLETGQNGTLTLYPGQGVGQTWLGADGATITFDQGVLKASRGMGDDLMGSSSFMPLWTKIKDHETAYIRELNYLTGNNKTSSLLLNCKMKKSEKLEQVEIWDVKFLVRKFTEECFNDHKVVTNIYYLDNYNRVRKSLQYHGETVGYIQTERLDR